LVFDGSWFVGELRSSGDGLVGAWSITLLHLVEVAQGLSQGQERAMIIERIWKDPKTTLLGLIIIGLCFVLVFFEKASLTEVSAFLMGAFALMFLKDPKDGKAADGK